MGKKLPIIAMMYDFDGTLCTKNMQEYGFIPDVNMKADVFWGESEKLARDNKMDAILAYMQMMIKKAKMAEISIHREDFVNRGKGLEFFPGVTGWFDRINKIGNDAGFKIEHYIISSGIKEIIEGCEINDHFEAVFACEFLYDANDVACWPKNVVNYTTKTQFLFRINKGVLDLSNDKDVNKYTPEDERPIPFTNMIYIGDGSTDVPCMKLVKVNGGHSIAVYQPRKKNEVEDLLKHNRVNFLAPADYSKDKDLEKIVSEIINKIASDTILKKRSHKQHSELTD